MACLRIVALGFPLYAYGMVLTQSFNGAGDTWTPDLAQPACFWVFEIPLAWALARPAGLGPPGVFWAIMAAFSMLALASVAVFRRGRGRRGWCREPGTGTRAELERPAEPLHGPLDVGVDEAHRHRTPRRPPTPPA